MSAVTVVIPAYNAASTLATQLEALAGQRGAPDFDVVVADNGSTDDTAAVARSFEDRLSIRVVDAGARSGPAFARNAGAAEAIGECLLFCDADDRVSDRWVAALCDAVRRDGLGTGPLIYVDASAILGGEPRLPQRLPTAPRRYLDQAPFAASANLGVRADLFHELGGFDPALQCGEDAHLTIRAQTAGHRLGWAQDAIVFHARRARLRDAARQFFRYGYYNALVYRKLRGQGLSQRTPWQLLRPYLVLLVTVHRLFTRRRWSWIINAAQRAGRVLGSLRFRVVCL